MSALLRSVALTLIGILFVLLIIPSEFVSAQDQGQAATPDGVITVAIKPIEPFVSIDEKGVPTGFSIDLWNAIAQDAGFEYKFVDVQSVKNQIADVEAGTADAAIAAISITRAREEVIDFSQPYYESGLQILTRQQDIGLSTSMLAQVLLSPRFLSITGAFLLAILAAGLLAWIFEHRTNPDFPRPVGSGIWNGIWWAAVTVFTVGYGDKTPRSVPGRLLAMLWMGLSLFLIANFTANITAALTVSQLQGSINGLQDLPGKPVATVDGSTSAAFLTDKGMRPVTTPDIKTAIEMLQAGDVDAVVYDSPVLQYYVSKSQDASLMLVPGVLNPENYGIALPQDSPFKEMINRELLKLIEDGTYREIKTRWFGDDNAAQ